MPLRPKRIPQSQSVREALLSAARRLFAQKGFEGVSVKDLAKETGHNAALVNYYFGNKQGLYRECVLPICGAGIAHVESLLRAANSKQDFLTRFELFVEDFIASHLLHQDVCIILHRDLHTDVVRQLFKDHMLCVCGQLTTFFDAAKKAKILRRDINADFFTSFVMNAMFSMVALDPFRISMNEQPYLDAKHCAKSVRQLTSLILHGCLSAAAPV